MSRAVRSSWCIQCTVQFVDSKTCTRPAQDWKAAARAPHIHLYSSRLLEPWYAVTEVDDTIEEPRAMCGTCTNAQTSALSPQRAVIVSHTDAGLP